MLFPSCSIIKWPLTRLKYNPRLSEITPEVIFEFQQKRLEEGVGKATVNRDLATLSSALTKARKLRMLVGHNPCSDVGKLNERRERRQANR
jgi:hypothetical protein